jgi:hypothetical protein
MERRRHTVWAAWLLCACSASEGQLFISVEEAGPARPALDGGAASIEAGADVATDAAPVQAGMRLQYQLTGTVDTSTDADLFVIDLFETSPGQIQALHLRGRSVIAFISAGSYEPWRPDVDALPAQAIGKPLAGYPSEAWLDVSHASVRQMMEGRLALAARMGFDGVLLVSLDAYLADSGHALSETEQLEYNVWLAGQAALAGLAAGISSDWRHAAQLAPHYAFAIHLNCLTNQRCSELGPYRALGRPVFDLETDTEQRAALCATAGGMELPVTFKRESFDAWFSVCP